MGMRMKLSNAPLTEAKTSVFCVNASDQVRRLGKNDYQIHCYVFTSRIPHFSMDKDWPSKQLYKMYVKVHSVEWNVLISFEILQTNKLKNKRCSPSWLFRLSYVSFMTKAGKIGQSWKKKKTEWGNICWFFSIHYKKCFWKWNSRRSQSDLLFYSFFHTLTIHVHCTWMQKILTPFNGQLCQFW